MRSWVLLSYQSNSNVSLSPNIRPSRPTSNWWDVSQLSCGFASLDEGDATSCQVASVLPKLYPLVERDIVVAYWYEPTELTLPLIPQDVRSLRLERTFLFTPLMNGSLLMFQPADTEGK